MKKEVQAKSKNIVTTKANTEIMEVKSQFLDAGENLANMITEELDGLNLSFDCIKIPSGGGVIFEVPSDDADNPDTVKEFKAVILYHHPVHALFKEKYTGASTPPDCSSIDGHIGIETETGLVQECKDCPNFQFGSGENGGKLCRQKRRIYILRENEALPIILSLPTGSLSDFSKYVMRLLSKGKKTSVVVTKFSLKKAQNSGGINYSQVVCAVDRDLTETEQKSINATCEQVKKFAGKVEVVEDRE